jgi:hypothetical protein
MQKREAAVTIRIPAALKRRLEARARAQRRSLSAQVVLDLEEGVSGRLPDGNAKPGRFLGLFGGGAAPTERDIAEVRRLLDTHACAFALVVPRKLGLRAKRVRSTA